MTATVAEICPTDEQERALAALLEGARAKRPVQTLGGYAGTGKTSVVRLLVAELPTYAACAFTGKAANVLRRQGVAARTIHGLIYEPGEDEETGQVVFRRRRSLPCDGIIVDEASMVGRELYDDLLRFGLPIIFVGDHGQLEPVGSDLNLMADPEHRLETIHRNAGEISRFAEWLRMGRPVCAFPVAGSGQVELIRRREEIEERRLWAVDQIICAYNRTRVLANALVRQRLGRTAPLVEIGERVMCLRNNPARGLYNGMQGTVTGYRRDADRHVLDLESSGACYPGIPFHPDQFGREQTLPRERVARRSRAPRRGPSGQLALAFASPATTGERNPFDYAYCVTCHKAQGDEFDTVLVLEQRCSAWEHRRWAYTAASRARRKIYWVGGF